MSGVWGPSLRDFWHSGDEDGVWGLEGVREKVARVTVSGVWNEKGKGVTCNGFWGSEKTMHKVSHVTASRVWNEKGKGVTCNGFWGLEGKGKRCHM